MLSRSGVPVPCTDCILTSLVAASPSAVRMKDAGIASEVIAVSIGPKQVRFALARSLLSPSFVSSLA